MERLLGQAAWNAAKQITKEKMGEGLKDFLLHKGKSMKRVSLPIYVPDSDFCWDKENIPCMYLDSYGTGCNLGLGHPLKDENNRLVKPKTCREL